MAAPHSEGVMEGWLYIFASNRIGLHCSRKRYFILKESFLRSFKDKPVSLMKVFFTFTVYNASNQIDQLKLGASSSEEAAKWIRLLKDAALKQVASSVISNFTDCVGLRMFKEARDWDSHGNKWGTHPVMMAVGVVDGTSEEIFHTLMSLGSSRSEGMKPRDFLLRRYWRREDNGTYGGGFLVTPINKGKQSLVKHMLAIDWKLWKLYLSSSSARFSTIRMLERVAALREFFKAKAGNCSSEPIEIAVDIKNEVTEENSKAVEGVLEGEVDGETSRRTNLMGLDDSDEFFDVSEPKNYDEFENEWHSAPLSEQHSQFRRRDTWIYKRLPAGIIVSHALMEPLFKKIQAVKAERTLMQMVGADWIQSNSRQDDLCSRPGSIVQGPWIVKQSVGNKPSLLGKALDIRYIRGRNYLEVDINIGSSTVARGVVNLVLGYLNNLVVGMAFLIQVHIKVSVLLD
ncbi:hypothetical protein JHK82_045179 [Glycine max]|nr:hypothetical protein JHK82_045179 [Glycine max]